ncbi:MAG TPA: glycosyltransferase [Candidatus Bathyarchaeia archaeon]|nr:glycosyltransferase [Candidatus Bathyarchaeia archaeon]
MKRALRILFVTNNYVPYKAGVVSSIHASIEGLQKSGHDVSLLTLAFSGAYVDPEYVHRIECPITFTYKKNPMAVPWNPSGAIREKIEQYRPDIIHVHHPFLLGPATVEATSMSGIPIIFTYHTLYDRYCHYVPLPETITKTIIKRLVTSFCRSVHGIIAPSTYVHQWLVRHTIYKPIQVIPSSLQSYFSPSSFFTHKTKNSYCNLLTVGRLVAEKNVSFLCEMFSQLPQGFTLTIAGYGADYEALCSYVYNTLHLSPEIVFFVHNPDKALLQQLYMRADLFLFASQTDTQAIVLAEAMAHGTPVIALDGPGQRDIVQEEYNGFLVDSMNHMQYCIEMVAQDGALHKKLQQGAWQTAHRYTQEAVTQKLVDFYYQLQQ